MAWVRVGPERDRLVNLEGFVDIQMVACNEHDGDNWAVEGTRRDRSSARLHEGARSDCQALLDEVAQAVWAIEVGGGTGVEGAGGPDGPYPGPTSNL